MSKLKEIIDNYGIVILDGAFSTELEAKGHNLNDPLWSAKLLIEAPEAVAEVHNDYFLAGADCAITASYQATYEGFIARGMTEEEAGELIKKSTYLAKDVRDKFWADEANRVDRPKPLIAASVGPYGAYLADGSEYRGDYDLDIEGLKKFHKKRLDTLISADADVYACETIPCLDEAKALAELLSEYEGVSAWISFSAKDGEHINSGEKVVDCAKYLDKIEQVEAIGINCTAPEYVESLIKEIRKGTDKAIVVYPNSGETYDANDKVWHGTTCCTSYNDYAKKWYEAGARIIGGCCRTTPADIKSITEWGRKVK